MGYDQVKSILVLAALLGAGGVFGVRFYRNLWANLRHGRPSFKIDQWGERGKGVLVYVGGQLRLFRFLIPGTAHFFIFWGFMLLSLTILQAVVEGLVSFANPAYVLPVIGTFGPLILAQDVITVAVIVAVIYALVVRLAVNPDRYQGSHKRQGVIVLFFILAIMLGLLVMNGARINQGEDALQAWRPVSRWVGGLFAGLPDSGQRVVEEISYWIHLGVVLIFLTELPTGKHFHVVTSIPAVLLRNLEPQGRLAPAPEFDNGEVGVSAVEQFSWRQMLDFFTCTECGRCQEVCPAYQSGLTLSPKLLMMALRDNLKERWEVRRLDDAAAQAVMQKALVGDVVSEADVWSCTTCFACDQECPLFIEHIAPIVDMRCSLVMEGRVDAELQDALANLGRYGNSFGHSPRARAKWTQGLDWQVRDARREPVEYLWFLGDYASYHPALAEITRKTAKVFQRAGLDFGILYDVEQNAGNDVRRVGEDGLAEMLAEKNLRALERCDFGTIVTTDPHTYNTLKNEYPFSNGGHRVVHYSELLAGLIDKGKLPLTESIRGRVTYQDPCYLGRYNGIFNPPRAVIESSGCELIEMERNRDRALCCGAGGGRIWMKEGDIKERPSEMLIREVVQMGEVSTLVVACPKDLVMFQDAIKTTGQEGRVAVKDLIELVYDVTR